MQKQVDIYMLRLDIPFKKSVVPSSRGEVIGIRKSGKILYSTSYFYQVMVQMCVL